MEGRILVTLDAVGEYRRSQHGDIIAVRLRFYLRNIVACVTMKNR